MSFIVLTMELECWECDVETSQGYMCDCHNFMCETCAIRAPQRPSGQSDSKDVIMEKMEIFKANASPEQKTFLLQLMDEGTEEVIQSYVDFLLEKWHHVHEHRAGRVDLNEMD